MVFQGIYFILHGGIRQSDPLSSYLFILYAELLARRMHFHSFSNSKLLGVKLGRSRVKVPFLTFAYDTMLFAKANIESCSIVKTSLDKYCSMHGQLVNFHTSAFQCTSNMSPVDSPSFKNILLMDNTFSLGNYLEFPIIDSRVNKDTFGGVLEK